MNNETMTDMKGWLDSLSPEKLKMLKDELLGEKKKLKCRCFTPSVKHFLSVEVHVTCKNCGTTKVFKHDIKPREVIHTITKDGVVTNKYYEKSCTLESYTKCCDNCLYYAKKMTRDELENAYMKAIGFV